MKNFISLISFLFYSNIAHTIVTCSEFQDENANIQVLREGNIINKENWKSFDVIASFDRNKCINNISQELIKVNGEIFWRFQTNDDSCDGGNTYGAIYTYDLKTPLAHIYDGDIICKDKWRDEDKAKNHKCDLKAEALAQKKMEEFGLNFKNLSSTLELRKSYAYSYIRVTGTVENKNSKSATVNVLTNIDRCSFGTVRLEYLEL